MWQQRPLLGKFKNVPLFSHRRITEVIQSQENYPYGDENNPTTSWPLMLDILTVEHL